MVTTLAQFYIEHLKPTEQSEVLLKKLLIAEVVMKLRHFMSPEHSFASSEEPSSGPPRSLF
jgi:hypothetical protein